MTRQSITVSEQAFERLKGHKRDDESWTDFAERVADLLDGERPTPDAGNSTDLVGECGPHSVSIEDALNSSGSPLLTEQHIDDIANRAARRTVDELETQLR